MKKIYTLFFLLLYTVFGAQAQTSTNFVTKWKFLTARTSLTFNADTNGSVNYTWSTPTASGTGSFTASGSTTINFPSINGNTVITLSMEPQNLSRFYFDYANNSHAANLREISNWGSVPWTNMNSAFYLCSLLNITATDKPDLSNVTSMGKMFFRCSALTGPSNIGAWNTDNVTDMSEMFASAQAFNQDISGWNTENVTDMRSMLANTSAFNQDISKWNIKNVINMNEMLGGASTFNQNLGKWILNANVDMSNMLSYSGMDCANYSKTLNGWYTNNPTVTGRTLGASGRTYGPAAVTARTGLLNDKGWTISGDAATSPVLVATGSEKNTQDACAGPFSDPADGSKKLLNIDVNGNALDPTETTVTISNKFVASPPTGVSTNETGGFYQANNRAKTIRISRRLHSIVAPAGTYAVNDGVIVRVYYDPAEITAIKDNNTKPTGSDDFNNDGWFKSSKHTAADVVSNLSSSGLTNAELIEPITPMGTGVEDGVSYAEFRLQTFSTIGYFASNLSGALPVTLLSFSGRKTSESQNTH